MLVAFLAHSLESFLGLLCWNMIPSFLSRSFCNTNDECCQVAARHVFEPRKRLGKCLAVCISAAAFTTSLRGLPWTSEHLERAAFRSGETHKSKQPPSGETMRRIYDCGALPRPKENLKEKQSCTIYIYTIYIYIHTYLYNYINIYIYCVSAYLLHEYVFLYSHVLGCAWGCLTKKMMEGVGTPKQDVCGCQSHCVLCV